PCHRPRRQKSYRNPGRLQPPLAVTFAERAGWGKPELPVQPCEIPFLPPSHRQACDDGGCRKADYKEGALWASRLQAGLYRIAITTRVIEIGREDVSFGVEGFPTVSRDGINDVRKCAPLDFLDQVHAVLFRDAAGRKILRPDKRDEVLHRQVR